MNDDINFLKELQHELNTQNNDGQASPRFWVLRDYRMVVTAEGFEDSCSLYLMDHGELYSVEKCVEGFQNGKEGFENDFTKEELEDLKDIYEFDSSDDVSHWFNENGIDCYLVYEKEESFIVPNTFFLTKAEAKRHIELNHYHYTDKVHTYAMTAQRAPKVERLLKILETFDWDEIEELAEDKSIFLKDYVEKVMDESEN